ncbi:MAG: alanyl-tRNA synthetase [Sphingobacteriales bacterium]|jgi:alanyl-tRNA synthetase
MNSWSSKIVRETFLNFFESKGHIAGKSAPMVVKDDPTLMFVNAGMNQFKDIFLGIKDPKHTRVANSQKCLRVSGKHNDLEEVGVDTYHHTMFEMLGNWSFGDYFKVDAINWAWELLTEVYKIDKESLYVTYFEGDKSEGLEPDSEAKKLWENWVNQDRILPGNKKDNFWEMGDMGPCGPCSEIHVDIRSEEEKKAVSGASLVNMDHPQVIEVWNLVFMEFNRKADSSLENLPAKHVDTGMGMERLCAVLEHKRSNYEANLFDTLIKKIQDFTPVDFNTDEQTRISFRVIADHLRAVSFAIADGQLPSNNGAGYVIRRILRRAVRYGYSFLSISEPFMYKLVPVLNALMGDYFDELNNQKTLIERVIKEEEESFLRTLEKGLGRINVLVETGAKKWEGDVVFELYDTFGFPVDLTRLIASENKIEIDEEGFTKALNKQKERSRSATESKAGDWIVLDQGAPQFCGYDSLMSETKILQYRKVEEKKKSYFQLVLEQSPFYPEGGGQVGDKGTLEMNGKVIPVFNTTKENNLPMVFVPEFAPTETNIVLAKVNAENRLSSARNHSATHLLHHVLRTELGTHVEQKGSLVNADYLRFDFSHFSKVDPEELTRIEEKVNALILQEVPLQEFRGISIDEAKEKGAMALFGEKYGDHVRMIQFGDSKELCGGTHVQSCGSIGLFKIVSEGSVASGVRRIEALSGAKAREWALNENKVLSEIKEMFKGAKDPVKNVEQLQAEIEDLSKKFAAMEAEEAKSFSAELLKNTVIGNGFKAYVGQWNKSAGLIKDVVFPMIKSQTDLVVVLGSVVDGKPTISVGVSDALITSHDFHAGKWVGELAKNIKGGGGGQAFFATAGGKNPDGIQKALKDAEEKLNI